jgi:hypothetical protein
MKEVQKSKSLEFTCQDGGSVVEAGVISVKRALIFKTYSTTEKEQIVLSLFKGEVLLCWVNEETKMQLTPLQNTLEVFEEAFRTRYMSKEYKHQQIGAFHVVR